MKSQQSRRLVPGALLFLGGLWLAGSWHAEAYPPPELRYDVRVEPGSGYAVTLTVSGLLGRKPRLRLLDGWGVLQDQSGHVREVMARDGAGPLEVDFEIRNHEAHWVLPRRVSGDVVLTYRVDGYDPYRSAESSFAAEDRFLLVGYSVFLVPEDLTNYDPIPITVTIEAPEGWPIRTSWPRAGSAHHPTTPHDLWSGVAAGGSFRESRMTAGAVSITVLTEDLLGATTGLTIANRILPVLRGMHDLFGAPPRGDSLDVLALFRRQPIRDNLSQMSGNSEEGAFLCLATPDRYRDPDQLTILATHECLHFYLGGAITANPEPPYRNAPELIWLMEGVTEFLTFHLLEQAGIITASEAQRVVAQKEQEYLSTRGWSAYTLADAARRMELMEVYGLVYSKGFLVGRMLEARMRDVCGSGVFEAALRQLFEENNAYRGGPAVTPEVVRRVFEERCPGVGGWIDRYALGHEPLPLVPETAERVGVE